MTLRRAHLFTAFVLLVFLAAHIANHLAAVTGPASHIAVMEALRGVYRHWLVEPVLLLAFAVQVVLGLRLLVRARNSVSGLVGWVQLLSGGYIAFFLLIHVGAVFTGRIRLGLDTNFWFAAAGYQAGALILWFVPYYFLAVMALFAHLACAAFWLSGGTGSRSRAWFVSLSAAGIAVSGTITAALMGAFEPFEIPPAYLETYSAFL